MEKQVLKIKDFAEMLGVGLTTARKKWREVKSVSDIFGVSTIMAIEDYNIYVEKMKGTTKEQREKGVTNVYM